MDIILEDYYDQGYEETMLADDQQYFDVEVPAVSMVWEACMHPSLMQGGQQLINYAFWNFLFRFISQMVMSPRGKAQHLSSIACGLGLQYYVLGESSFYGFAFSGIAYLLFYTLTTMDLKPYGFKLASFCIIVLVIGELLDTDQQTWHRMRGTQMVAAMKIISLCFDIDRSNDQMIKPNVFEFWGYILSPANVTMGPWCSYGEYKQVYQKLRWPVESKRGNFFYNCMYRANFFSQNARVLLKWCCQVMLNCLLAAFFLIACNCLISSFIPGLGFIWLIAYKGAFSYRCSHYFVCFLSQSTMMMAGYKQSRLTAKNKSMLGYSITKPWLIEMPRSLVNVVVYWNLSMHYWLKTYVFQQMRPYGKFSAILFTYLISALLHGINVPLASVLLTLGFATYAEYTVRSKMAEIFDACILASACRVCQHRYKANNVYVIAINAAFTVLAIVNLAYLGIMFEEPMESENLTFQLQHVLTTWGGMKFFTHWVIGFTFILIAFI